MIMSGGNGDESSGDELVCYCFGYTRKDIQRDWWNHNGRSTILADCGGQKGWRV